MRDSFDYIWSNPFQRHLDSNNDLYASKCSIIYSISTVKDHCRCTLEPFEVSLNSSLMLNKQSNDWRSDLSGSSRGHILIASSILALLI